MIHLSDRFASRPDARRVHQALSDLYHTLITEPGKRGVVIPFDAKHDKFVILSDQHKGARDYADDFALAEDNYLAALNHYENEGYHYINLGDSEELWENSMLSVKKHNQRTFDHEKTFLVRQAFIKIFGNHDLYWDNDPLASIMLRQLYGQPVKVWEGVILRTTIDNDPLDIYLTHGHQGDLQSDGNWLSKWFVANVWAPLQSFLEINLNTPATNDALKTLHNQMMYDWSSTQKDLLLITGHTHQPVFCSLTHLERLYLDLEKAEVNNDADAIAAVKKAIGTHIWAGEQKFSFPGYRPSYFNTGCCCFDDGDITGIEIAQGQMRLIKWSYDDNGDSERIVLDESSLSKIITGLKAIPK